MIDPSKITNSTLDRIHELYPANSTMNGAPHATGDSLFDRAAAWYTDNMFLGPRRLLFDKAASLEHKLFAYHFAEVYPGSNPTLGGERSLLYGLANLFNIVPKCLMAPSLPYSLVPCRLRLKTRFPIR